MHTVFCEYFAIWEGQNSQTIRISLFTHFLKLAKARAIYNEEPTDRVWRLLKTNYIYRYIIAKQISCNLIFAAIIKYTACAADETKLRLRPSAKRRPNTSLVPGRPRRFGMWFHLFTCQACRENSPRTPRAIALGSKPPHVTRIARPGLGTRLPKSLFCAPTCVPGFECAPWLAC